MWLPHGLAADVTLPTLKPLITICRYTNPNAPNALGSYCAPLAFNLSRPSKGQLRMSVGGLEGRQRYRVAVQGSAQVKDAFGLQLQVRWGVGWGRWFGVIGERGGVVMCCAVGAAVLLALLFWGSARVERLLIHIHRTLPSTPSHPSTRIVTTSRPAPCFGARTCNPGSQGQT